MYELSELLKDGDVVECFIKRVSRRRCLSGRISFFVEKNNRRYIINHEIAKILGYKTNGYSVYVEGCVKEMSSKIVSDLSEKLGVKLNSWTL